MRIYEGSPRQHYEEVLRSMGAFLDQRGMREIMLTEVPDGFIVQGLVGTPAQVKAWAVPRLQVDKETYTFVDDDIARFIEEALARRHGDPPESEGGGPVVGQYEDTLRIIGRYVDQQKPRDISLLEQDGAYVIRVLMGTRQGARHVLAEFTADELRSLVDAGPSWRGGGGGSP